MANIIYKDIAPGAKEAATPSIQDIQDFCDPNDLKNTITVPKIATLEMDYWKLDGTFGVMPEDREGAWGIWSNSLSGEDGSFATPPELTLSFGELHTSVGITLYFDPYGPDWCNDLNIKWYRGASLLSSKNYAPDAVQYTCLNEVKNYNKLVITFRSTSKPYRYLKLSDILYGYIRAFDSSELRSVHLYQAASVLSEEVEINSLNLVVSSKDPIPFVFQHKQPLEVYQDDVLQGVFYIKSSKRQGERLYYIEADDTVGLLADSTHMGGIYHNVTAATVIADILDGYAYDLNLSLGAVVVTGWLPIASRRDNLAQVAFAIGAVVDTSGSDKIRIYPAKTAISDTLDPSRVFSGSDIDTDAVVTRVEVTEHAYSAGSDTKDLYQNYLDGSATVTFSEPMHSLTITGGTIASSGANYAVITASGATVTLKGSGYRHTTRIRTQNNTDASALDQENVIQVTDATLVSSGNSASVAQRVFDRYMRRNKVNAKLLLGDIIPGDVISISTEFDGIKTGTVQSLDINLSRKRIGEAVILCQ